MTRPNVARAALFTPPFLAPQNASAGLALLALLLLLPAVTHAAADGAWRALTPPQRLLHAAVYDPVRDRMLVIGGSRESDGSFPYDDVWELTLTGTPSWERLVPGGAAPEDLVGHSAIYDPVGDRVIVYGGPVGFGSDYTWELRLSPELEWNHLITGDPQPEVSTLQGAVYDSDEHRMIIFGGIACTPGGGLPVLECPETWALSLSGDPTWTLIAEFPHPAGRWPRNAMVYDENDDRIILYGGEERVFPFGDLWELSLSGAPTWTELFASGASPEERGRHVCVFDPVRDRMLVYGGYGDCIDDVGGGSVDCTHVWELSLAGTSLEWTELTPAGIHPGRLLSFSGIYDGPRDRVLLYGGILYPGGEDAELSELDVAALYLTSPETWGDLTPRARIGAASIYDSLADAMFVFGGSSANGERNDLWALQGNDESHGWTEVQPSGDAPPARSDAAAAADALRHRLIIFGGTDGTTDLGDVWAIDLDDPTGSVWTPVTPPEAPPAPRSGHSADYDPSRDRVVIFGGRSGTMAHNDVWALSFSSPTPSWSFISTSGGPPPPRFDHTAVFDPSRDVLLVFGGSDGSIYFNDVWGLFFSAGQTPMWVMAPTVTPMPAPRRGHGMVHDTVRDRLVIFGGTDAMSVFDDVWALNLPGTPTWEPLAPFGPIVGPRTDHVMVYDVASDRAVVFGGSDGGALYTDALAIAWGEVVAVDRTPPNRAALLRVVPNPTSSDANVIVESARAENARLAIYDVRGRLVRDLKAGLVAGRNDIVWDGRDHRGEPAPAGVYFGRVSLGGRTLEAKIVVVR